MIVVDNFFGSLRFYWVDTKDFEGKAIIVDTKNRHSVKNIMHESLMPDDLREVLEKEGYIQS